MDFFCFKLKVINELHTFAQKHAAATSVTNKKIILYCILGLQNQNKMILRHTVGFLNTISA